MDEKGVVRAPRGEALEPPLGALCWRCGGRRNRFCHSTVMREHGIRRVTRRCDDCGALLWYDEELVEQGMEVER